MYLETLYHSVRDLIANIVHCPTTRPAVARSCAVLLDAFHIAVKHLKGTNGDRIDRRGRRDGGICLSSNRRRVCQVFPREAEHEGR